MPLGGGSRELLPPVASGVRIIAVGGALAVTLLALWLVRPILGERDDTLRVEVRFSNNAGTEATTNAVCDRTKPCVIQVPFFGAAADPPIALDLRAVGDVVKATIVRWVGEHQKALPVPDWSLNGMPFFIILGRPGVGSGGTDVYLRTKDNSDIARMNKSASIGSDLVYRRVLPTTTLTVIVWGQVGRDKILAWPRFFAD
jgi:hypothetical protein